jgi:Tfp pilus assembly protein PilE
LILIGVLGAVAWPVFSDYVAGTRVREGLVLALPAQDAIEQAFRTTGPMNFSAENAIPWSPPPPGANVQSVSVERSGRVVIHYTVRVSRAGKNRLEIVPQAQGKALDLSDPANAGKKFLWRCGGGNSTVPEKYRGDCR